MDAQVKAIQERLRAKMSQPMELGEKALGLPIVSFEDVAGIPDGAETLVHRVVRALHERGHRVACLRRFGPDNVPDAAAQVGGSYIGAGDGAACGAGADPRPDARRPGRLRLL